MNTPAHKPNLEISLHSWWTVKQDVQQLQQTIKESQDHLKNATARLHNIENDICQICECNEKTLVYEIDGVTIVLAWQEEQNYHTVELATLKKL